MILTEIRFEFDTNQAVDFDCGKGRGISRCLAKSGHNIILTYHSNIDAANENKLFIEENYSERVTKL